MNRVSRFVALTPAERGLFVEALVWLPAISVALRLLGFRRSCAVVQRTVLMVRTGGVARGDVQSQARRAAQLVGSASGHGWGRGGCLPRLLTLWRLLRRRGIDATLRIGVRTGPTTVEAHAWVEHHGVVLDDGDDGRPFTPFSLACVLARLRAGSRCAASSASSMWMAVRSIGRC